MPAPGPLPPPPYELATLELPIIERSQRWFRSHPIDRGPIFYGKQRRWRFDDPDAEYGVLYVAQNPHGAFVETFGQFVSTVAFPRRITTDQLLNRVLSELDPNQPLRLVDLTGPGLARIGADSRLFAGEHANSQQWSKALYSHPSHVDGVLYPARHDPEHQVAAIFNASLQWVTLSRKPWLSLGLELRNILERYNFALIESQFVPQAVRKGPKQESMF